MIGKFHVADDIVREIETGTVSNLSAVQPEPSIAALRWKRAKLRSFWESIDIRNSLSFQMCLFIFEQFHFVNEQLSARSVPRLKAFPS
jgi:hypothetical protein